MDGDGAGGRINRKASVSMASDTSSNHAPSLSQPHRRTSRADHMLHGYSRRMSTLMGLRRPSIASHRTDDSKKNVKLQNTYKLEPDEGKKFSAAKVEKMLHSVLQSFLAGETYDPAMCANLTRNISNVIKSRVQEFNFPRYKFICHVMIAQNGAQSMQAVSRALWDTNTDTFVSATYKNTTFHAVANVYGVYFP